MTYLLLGFFDESTKMMIGLIEKKKKMPRNIALTKLGKGFRLNPLKINVFHNKWQAHGIIIIILFFLKDRISTIA